MHRLYCWYAKCIQRGYMRKFKNQDTLSQKDKALEIIELEINDLQTLARAFNVIAEACGSTEQMDAGEPQVLVH